MSEKQPFLYKQMGRFLLRSLKVLSFIWQGNSLRCSLFILRAHHLNTLYATEALITTQFFIYFRFHLHCQWSDTAHEVEYGWPVFIWRSLKLRDSVLKNNYFATYSGNNQSLFSRICLSQNDTGRYSLMHPLMYNLYIWLTSQITIYPRYDRNSWSGQVFYHSGTCLEICNTLVNINSRSFLTYNYNNSWVIKTTFTELTKHFKLSCVLFAAQTSRSTSTKEISLNISS